MRTGIFFYDIFLSSDPWTGDWDALLSFLRGLGIGGMQFGEDEIRTQGEERVLSAFQKHGMRMDAVHVFPRLLARDDEAFASGLMHVRRSFDLLERFDCHRLMIVPLPREDVDGPADHDRALERMAQGLRILMPEANARGIDLFVENFSTARVPYTTVEDILRLRKAVPNLKYVFDTGNFVCVGIDPLTAYERLKKHISLLHLKSFVQNDSPDSFLCDDGIRVAGLPLDQGNLTELMAAFVRDGITAQPIIEHSVSVSRAEIARSVALVRSMLGD